MTQITGQTKPPWMIDRAAEPLPWAWLRDYCQLAKLRLTLMVVITTFVGYGMGSRHIDPQHWSYLSLLATLAGTAFSCIGAGAFNQILERRIDAKMHRTKYRPLPAGRMSSRHAFVYAALASTLGILLLAAFAHALSAAFAAITIISYALIYTPVKRVSSVSTIIGAVPGALPPVIGFTAATGHLGIEAYVLFALLFLWQLPHFLAIAWLYRADYARAELPVLPVVEYDGTSTFRQILLSCLALLPLGLVPTFLGISGVLYFFVALGAGGMFLAAGTALAVYRTRRHARFLFFASLVYLPTVFSMMLIDRA